MIKLLLLSIFLLSACSFKTPPNQWQYKSTNALNSYAKNFLSSEDVLAKDDLRRAVKHAKKSADLIQLSKIYLSECALNVSVGERSGCDDYEEISQTQASQELNAYYSFVNLHIEDKNIKLLPLQYQEFAAYVISKEYAKAQEALLKIEKTTSLLLCASLIKDNLDANAKEKILQRASYSGYKKAVLFWLRELLKDTQNPQEIQKIKKKISILIT